jgi:hypothetical protein
LQQKEVANLSFSENNIVVKSKGSSEDKIDKTPTEHRNSEIWIDLKTPEKPASSTCL